MKLAVDVAADCYWAFLKGVSFRFSCVLSIHTTGWTFDSSCSTSLAYCLVSAGLPHDKTVLTLSHNLRTSLSANCLQFIRLSIQPSKVGMDWVSETGDKPWGCAGLPTSTSIFESMLDSMLNCFSAVLADCYEYVDLGFGGWGVYRVRGREGCGKPCGSQ